MPPTYLDHNATTPLDPRARDAMLPWLEAVPANASSVHGFGQVAREAIDEARSRVSTLLGASEPTEVVFTASGTEALNSVILGIGRQAGPGGHLVISAIEHPAVQAAAEVMVTEGLEVTRVAPSPSGRLEAAAVAAALRPETVLAAVMLANNEVGSLQPVAEVSTVCRSRGVPLLCDAVQAVGKLAVDVEELGADYVAIGAHKFYGPLGAAALWIRPRAPYRPLLVGGSQERRRRAGTENLPAIVGLGCAAELARLELGQRRRHMSALRDRFEGAVSRIDDVRIHAADVPRLPNTSHLAFFGVSAQSLMIRLDLAGFAVSAGSACSSGKTEASPTLKAMRISEEEALSCLRVSFGATNTFDEVDAFVDCLEREIAELRRLGEGQGS